MICAGKDHSIRLPQSDLVYTAFRLCFFDVACELDLQREPWTESPDDDPDDVMGFLAWKVPFFRAVPPVIQLDLLAALWHKHHSNKLHEVYLAEAAVLYAILRDAGRIAVEIWDGKVADMMKRGPRTVAGVVQDDVEDQLAELFERFWDDEDFLLIEVSQDGVPFQQTGGGDFLGIPSEWIDEMYEILTRAKPRPEMMDDLKGLLSDAEREEYRFLTGPHK